MSNTATARISKDLREVNSIADLDTPPIPVADELDHAEALIVGPPDTPYEFGFLRFGESQYSTHSHRLPFANRHQSDLKFSNSYPNKPPKVMIETTDHGRVRLNPNLYAGGKVCLSILGTWTGESADEWRSTYSIHYILRAIQSLILTTKPYHNEPGYEENGSDCEKPEEIQAYSDKIKHESLRVCVCGVLEEVLSTNKSSIFGDIIKNHFLLYYHIYMKRAQEETSKDGEKFSMMAFEYPDNGCSGSYNYAGITTRLQEIKGKIESETQQWKENGHELTKAESGWKYYRLIEENDLMKKGTNTLEGTSAGPASDDNVYLWNATIFGPQDSLWEGGIYNVEIVFNDKDNPPRVKFLCDMWHPNITKDGYPFFAIPPNAKEPVMPILIALRKLLTNEPNSSSATWVNPTAAEQYFNKEEGPRQDYKRKVAQCVRRTMEM
ncbi:ubiquitin-conjugating enzyme E2Z [Planoprotostelium fungivorum]|uniref:Ubiquitin-conjugating enzyme E2 Z n=1 Tax=Planoprotostelium fungivorum TaxID=1890364 RepID=A0A2P6P0C4_9EUKA|nr:ubiquitin-conjugating enzyme E2Z [Planoprotostelium fungivorum]